MFEIGDKVIVKSRYERERKIYPFMPDLAKKQGEVIEIKKQTPLGNPLDEAIYYVKCDTFKIGVIRDGGHAVNAPIEWRDECLFCFLEDELKKV